MSSTASISACHAEPWLLTLYPEGVPSDLRTVRVEAGMAPSDLSFLAPNAVALHLLFPAAMGLGARIRRAWQVARMSWRLTGGGWGILCVGYNPTLESPTVVLTLRRNICRYTSTVSFRHADSPLRSLIKRLLAYLPATLLWSGPLVLVADPAQGVANFHGAENVFNRLTLISRDRQIAFLFRGDNEFPWAVRKSGDPEAIADECRKHRRAISLLGPLVPSVLGEENEGTPSFSMEYLAEHFLINAVAAAWFGHRRIFVREALAHVAFCLQVYRHFAQGSPPVVEPVLSSEVDELLSGLNELRCPSAEFEPLAAALQDCVGAMLPRLIQHGDFCVRNVLITGGERGRILIDWEDLQEQRWPLADFALLRLSLKEAYAGLFSTDLEEMARLAGLARGLAEAEEELGWLLGLDRCGMKQAALLSLACLCRQNLNKKRYPTARTIFHELLRVSRA